ncbi:MAG: T9SS C-terminal target domain-containing protein, partial [Bacteroidales bacterium]|nr:T9SS C-terminal target domain-containing protein [Bacteroidales bacterium]
MRRFQKLVFLTVAVFFTVSVYADKEHRPNAPKPKSTTQAKNTAMACEPSKTSTELYVNNVRTLIHTGGDMWWDLQERPRYEVPAGSGRHALFAGSIWVGGKDANGQLKMAAQRFRQDGIDFWPGPLIVSGAQQGTTSQDICRQYDKHFVITKEMVKEFREWFACTQDPECDASEEFPFYSIPDIIMNWPAHGPAGGYDTYLAPFWDVDGDGYYNPLMGDFPYYEFPNEGITDDPDCIRPRNRMPKLFGDHTLWWVYNDRGNIHTETGGDPIGMEFRAQAFAFSTNDELNDMTFYNYNIINRSTYTLYETYFGVWTDADLGGAVDDYTGCDVERGLGYVYNGDDFDDDHRGSLGYGAQPPAIGIDFFEGPYQDPTGQDKPTSYDTINGVKVLNCQKGDILNGNINGLNFGDGVADNERWGMRRFLYFNNTGEGANAATTDPHTAIEHYNYLTGYWKDGAALCYGGTGHPSGGGDPSTPTDFMFPGKPTTDKCGWGQGGVIMPDWSEETEDNPPDDKRFVQSAGPFVLRPGAVNDITIGAVYA